MSPLSKLALLSGRAWRVALAAPVVLLVFASAGNTAEASARTHANRGSGINAAPISGAYFAIADLDGDQKPDLATVEVQSAVSAHDLQYSIRLELSASAPQSFGVIAPIGGLQIVARDVNGDSFLDLLVSTVWQHQQVAVFLNDGHGNFTLASPGAFAASFRDDTTKWNLQTAPFCDTAILDRTESSARGMRSERDSGFPLQVIGAAHPKDSLSSIEFLLLLTLGRAPPLTLSPA